jgi:hypothetical protein
MTSNLINISDKISTAKQNSSLALNYDLDIIKKPIFYNSNYYNAYNPIIKQVFNSQSSSNNINIGNIQNCDFMTYMFPTSNKIQFCSNSLCAGNKMTNSNTYSTQYLHFTSVCPVKIKDIRDITYSIIIECTSGAVRPLLIIIPVEYSTTDTNTDLDLLIKYSQTNSTTYPTQNDNIYINNIFPLTQEFYFFNQPVNTTVVSCDIIIFNTTVKTSYNIATKGDVQPWTTFNNTVTTLTNPANITYVTTLSTLYKSTIPASVNPVISENDIYIDCSVVKDSTTSTNNTIRPLIRKKKQKNVGLLIIGIILIFVCTVTIYMWIFGSASTTIRSRPKPIPPVETS